MGRGIMKLRWQRLLARSRRGPEVVYVVCPSCQEKTRADAIDAVALIDSHRQMRTGQDPLLDQVLGQAEMQFAWEASRIAAGSRSTRRRRG